MAGPSGQLSRRAIAGLGVSAVAAAGFGLQAAGALAPMLRVLGFNISNLDDQRLARLGSPRHIDWVDLVRPEDVAALPQLRDGTQPRGVVDHGELAPAPRGGDMPELARTLGGFRDMYAPPRRLSDAVGGIGNLKALQPPGGAGRADLDGAVVRLAGFVAPLAFEGGQMTEFLLSPYVGACIHVPPPPANQVVRVADLGDFRPQNGVLHPVLVTGRLRVGLQSTDLADAAYLLEDAVVEKFEQDR